MSCSITSSLFTLFSGLQASSLCAYSLGYIFISFLIKPIHSKFAFEPTASMLSLYESRSCKPAYLEYYFLSNSNFPRRVIFSKSFS